SFDSAVAMPETQCARGRSTYCPRASCILVTFELRRPLGGERGHPFPIVFAVAEIALQVALDIELRRQGVACGGLQCFLDRGQTSRGRLSEMSQELLRDGRQLGVLDALPDEPPLRRLLRGELVAQERKAERARVADHARQE